MLYKAEARLLAAVELIGEEPNKNRIQEGKKRKPCTGKLPVYEPLNRVTSCVGTTDLPAATTGSSTHSDLSLVLQLFLPSFLLSEARQKCSKKFSCFKQLSYSWHLLPVFQTRILVERKRKTSKQSQRANYQSARISALLSARTPDALFPAIKAVRAASACSEAASTLALSGPPGSQTTAPRAAARGTRKRNAS